MKIEIEIAAAGVERRVDIAAFPAVIGRSPGCAARIDDPRASREHAAIEEREGQPVLVDPGSRNGTWMDGGRVAERVLEEGDEIRIGSTTIRIAAIREAAAPKPAPEPAGGEKPVAPRLRVRRLPLGYRIGTALFVILAAGALAYHFAFSSVKPPPADPDLAARKEAETRYVALQRVAGTAVKVLPDLIDQAETLRDHYARLFEGSRNPFGDLAFSLRTRREMEVAARVAVLEGQVRKLLDGREYSEAMRVAGEGPEPLIISSMMREEDAEKLRRATEEEVRRAAKKAEEEAVFLEGLERDEDLKRLCEKAILWFNKTSHSPSFHEKLRFAEARLVSAAARQMEAEERRARLIEEERAAVAAVPEALDAPAPISVGLSAILAAPIRAGAFAARKYKFGDIEGSPIAIDEGLVLAVRGAGGDRKVPFAEVPAAVQLAMAHDGLSGESLLAAASFGYGRDLRREADRILFRYLKDPKGGGQKKVDEFLVRARGYDALPPGGFSYSPDFGWEDARSRTDRESVGTAIRLIRGIKPTSTPDGAGKAIDGALAFLSDSRLSTEGRAEVRRVAVESLNDLRARCVREVAGLTKRKGFLKLRKAKEELERRRTAALNVIFNLSVYLPEDHPNWPKGDTVNGQKAVDEAVGAVRSLWDEAGKNAIKMDPRAAKLAEVLERIEAALTEKLFSDPRQESSEELEEIRNNLDREVDLRRYASTKAEADLYRYNRKVDEYNRGLKDADVSDEDKAHVEVVNDYREMLGLRRLFIDPRLCRATRKHSAACAAAGRIWHVGPDGTPGSRASHEGFPGGVAENVAMGYASPKEIWTRGWYRASDHHRNGIAKGHTCMGYGFSGGVGTQNFSALGAPFR
jgi:uncharacterized protein YkwD/pyruvate/2-oxoglutarate dehydrogenase complex dihydrolipoamide acyltransferase (E2) component